MDEKELKRQQFINLGGLYTAMISFLLICVISLVSGTGLSVALLLRCVFALLLAWPIGCLLGFIAANIIYENNEENKETESPEEENNV